MAGLRQNKLFSGLFLKPLSWIYGTMVYVRNKLFDWGILKGYQFKVPVIVVGNLAVGGTGKTPHTEYIVEALRDEYHIGVLSRGYRRKTKGFVTASKLSTPRDIGDEPYQIYHKFGGKVRVAVCESRVKGIKEMLRIDPTINMIVLDDAFQHRYVTPLVSVVLMEWTRPVYNDDLLPLGNLREQPRGLMRADMVIVTKCPSEIRPVDVRLIYEHLELFPYQTLYFSHYLYGNLVSVFPDDVRYMPSLSWMGAEDSVLVLTGIAHPRPLVRYVKNSGVHVVEMRFPDHHQFSRHDFDDVLRRFNAMPGTNKYIITTEKDAVRIAANPYYPHDLRSVTFYLPIKVDFLPHRLPAGSDAFAQELKQLIRRKNSVQ